MSFVGVIENKSLACTVFVTTCVSFFACGTLSMSMDKMSQVGHSADSNIILLLPFAFLYFPYNNSETLPPKARKPEFSITDATLTDCQILTLS